MPPTETGFTGRRRGSRTLLAVTTMVGIAGALATATAYGAATTAASYPPPSTERSNGLFVIRCSLSHQFQVDPIVNPGGPSGHLHDFFGNRSVSAGSTYSSMVTSPTTCGLLADTAGYWAPSLVALDGTVIKPRTMFAYYRNKPYRYGTTMPFPKDFRVVAGGVGTYPYSGWSCEQDAKNLIPTLPSCGSKLMVLHVKFPNCWNGVTTDSGNHRSHVVYPVGSACPSSHPVKVPEIFMHVRYPPGVSGPAYKLSDGTIAPHTDFWNTWQQPKLEELVRRCLNAGIDCGTQTG